MFAWDISLLLTWTTVRHNGADLHMYYFLSVPDLNSSAPHNPAFCGNSRLIGDHTC
jgi:hypothetical protein